jgi:hypothetical protein
MRRIPSALSLGIGLTLAVACGQKPTIEKTLPTGTPLAVELLDTVSSASSSAGDAVAARVTEDVVVDHQVIIPAGATVNGQVVEARGLKKIGGRALLRVVFESVDLPGDDAAIHASWAREGKSETKKDVATIGGATAGGALLGRVLSDNHKGRGTTIGALVGGAAGTAIAAGTHGEEIVLVTGTRLNLRLDRSVSVKVEA